MNRKIQSIAIFTAIFLIFCFSLLVAQENSYKGGGAGYFAAGIAMIDMENLNAKLTAKGYPEFKDNFITMGGAGHSFMNKLVIGGEGYGLTQNGTTVSLMGTTYKSQIGVGYGFFDIGYLLYSTKRMNIFPMLGIGGGGVTMDIVETGSVGFDDVLSAPKRNVSLEKAAFLLNFSLNAEYFIAFEENKDGMGGLLLGVQMGYTFAPYTSDWKIDEYDVTGGPDFKFNGPYVRVMFGGGGMGR